MSVLDTKWPTLVDLAKRTDPNGAVAVIGELLNQSNEILDDMPFVEANKKTSHQSTVRTGLPGGTWRKLYGGVQPSKSRTAQVTDNCGNLEAYAEVDKDLADLGGNAMSFRLSEDVAHIEGMSQDMATTLFYGNEDDNEAAFTGLAPRFNSLSAENGENIVDAGGSGSDNTSMWLVVWHTSKVFGIVPQGSTGGIHQKDLGEVTLENADGANGRMQAYRTHYKWQNGLVVKDWRSVVRIPNIDISDLNKDASGSSADLIDLMIEATEIVEGLSAGRAAFYCNRKVRSYLRRQIANHKNTNLSEADFTGASGIKRHTPMFDGIPIRRCDALLNTEARVV